MSWGPVERFVTLIRERTGNVVPTARRGFVTEMLARRAQAAGLPVAGYVERLAEARDDGEVAAEWDGLIPMVTIKESYFFRAPQQFAALERRILPRLAQARAESRRLRIWSAACARGEEPGTLAVLLAENELLRGWDWRIVATDVDREALETARRGLYGERAIARVPPAQLERWFRPRGKLYELVPELRRRIVYRHLNLARPPYRGLDEAAGFGAGAVGAGGAGPNHRFDLVFLRNVLIYFPRTLQRRVVAAVSDRLAEDGALFLGASETLWQIQRRLSAYDLGNCFCYRHRTAEETEATLTPLEPIAGPPPVSPAVEGRPADRVDGDSDPGPHDVPWLSYRDGGGGARDRDGGGPARDRDGVARNRAAAPPEGDGLTAEAGDQAGGVEPAEPVSPPVSIPIASSSPPSLADALEAQDDDEEDHLHSAPCGIQDRLLEVARRLEAGEVDTAAAALESVLEADPSEPAAHALDGFVHDLRDEAEDAVQSYRAALYLDPALYQVRLLLADCMNRQGWHRRAAHEYREVLAALEAGTDRALVPFDPLPVPDREGAERRCRRALAGG